MEMDGGGRGERAEEEEWGAGGQDGEGSECGAGEEEEEECASTAGPRRKILEEGTTREIPGPKESHLGETY